MTLPAPNLDDRTFQDIVDEAKRLIPRYCPEWTDHNVSDPGVALIELFAWMTEATLFRLNQVPDRLYTKFLELWGITLFPPAAARADVAFTLSTPMKAASEEVTIPAGTEVGTVRTEHDESVVFTTDFGRTLVPGQMAECLTVTASGEYTDRIQDLGSEYADVLCFPNVAPDDALILGFDRPMPGHIVELVINAAIKGHGIDPDNPPLRWEASTAEGWGNCRVLLDSTYGLNREGTIQLVLPQEHTSTDLEGRTSNWIRCRLLAPEEGQPGYVDSPEIDTIDAHVIGGVITSSHGVTVPREVIGTSSGEPGQVFKVRMTPVLPPRDGEAEVMVDGDDEEPWVEVSHFRSSGPHDRHFVWDRMSGEIRFGPQVHNPDGTARHYGAIPRDGSEISVGSYRFGGGRIGNVGKGTIQVLKTSIPFVASVENLDAARGGVDGESVDNAKVRGPVTLRSSNRAVTAADYERLARESSPHVARSLCLAPADPDDPVRVLIVPRFDIDAQSLRYEHLGLPESLRRTVEVHLDERRMLTTRIEVMSAAYLGISVTAKVIARAGVQVPALRQRALDSLYTYINPVVGGPDGMGWPFGRDLNIGELFALLSGIDGVVGVTKVDIQLTDLATGQRNPPEQRVEPLPGALFASAEHSVEVDQ